MFNDTYIKVQVEAEALWRKQNFGQFRTLKYYACPANSKPAPNMKQLTADAFAHLLLILFLARHRAVR